LTKNDLTQAYELLLNNQKENPSTALANSSKWKKLGDLSLDQWKIKLAQDCFWLANDYSSLLLLLSSSNNKAQLTKLAEICETKGKYNIAYQAWWLIGNKEKCMKLLMKGSKFTEAAFLGKNYNIPVDEAVTQWKSKLSSINKSKISDRIIVESESLIDLDQTNGSVDPVTEAPVAEAPVTEAPVEEAPTEAPTEA